MDLPAGDEDYGLASFWRTYRVPILLGSLSIFLAVLSIVLLIKSSQTVTPIQFSHTNDVQGASTHASQSANLGTILVDIEGAVVHPGVIRLPIGSRVEEVIQAAGGLRNTADAAYVSQNINRAMKVVDGMKVYIPSLEETKTSHNSNINNITGETSHNLGPPSVFGGSSQNGSAVSVNSASKDQLDSLPGVGPVTAQKIINNRPYAGLDELVTKKAIGPSLFEKLKNMLSL